jgi:hypothetical protein
MVARRADRLLMALLMHGARRRHGHDGVPIPFEPANRRRVP